MTEAEKKRGATAGVWVLLVLLVGIAAGLVLAALPIGTTTAVPSPGRGSGWHLELSTASDYDVILSTVGITLLLALLVVYGRVYGDTKANFSLGLIVVLLALLFQSILTSPLVFGVFGQTSDGLGIFLALADIFKVVAFAVFLYLSLE